VVTIPHGSPENMTANLKAPVAVNLSNRIMAQIILENSDYPLKKAIKKES
jgi:flagellar assembly factor FliW